MVPSSLQMGARPPSRCQSSGGTCLQVVQPEVRRFIVAAPRGDDDDGAAIGRKPRIFQRALRLPDNTLDAVRA